ncbi:MAG: hypothetical protein JWP88_2009 [Flaviaesturariibacter sp.]|nr:hypothetical protein [Flaviaesturariibacter sp.]
MENSRNRNGQSEPSSSQNNNQTRQSSGAAQGFEGMNFEEQRSSYKNSDGAGAPGNEKGLRNGGNDRQDV